MADLKQLEDRLKEIGCNFRLWGRAELRELANVLLPGEVVEHCVNGQYTGGFAMLVATDQRVLLIDKKPMYLTLEDTRYDMVTEVDFNHRLMDASIYIRTPSKSLHFTAYNQARLRKMFNFVQKRVMEIRQHYQQVAAQQFAQQFGAPQGTMAGMQQLQPYVAQPYGQQPMVQQIMPTQSMYSQQLVQRTVAPIISAYTRLPMMSRQRRFLGSRAINTSSPGVTPPIGSPLYPGGQPQLQ